MSTCCISQLFYFCHTIIFVDDMIIYSSNNRSSLPEFLTYDGTTKKLNWCRVALCER